MPRYEGVWTLTQQGQAKGAGNWPGPPTAAPTIGTATAGNASASVAFTGVSDATVTIYRATSTPGNITATGTTSPISVTGLTNGTSYTFTVAAGNGLGYGPESAASNSITPVAPEIRGIFFGGATGSFGGTPINVIQYINISTTANSLDFGDLISPLYQSSACSSSTRGICAGGKNGSFVAINVIQYITIASAGNATDFGDLLRTTSGGTSSSNSITGLFAGDESSASSNISYITIATTGNATFFGNLSSQRWSMGSCSSSTRSVFAGGDNGSTVNVIDYVTIASTGNATYFGDLNVAAKNVAGCSNSTRGLFFGGGPTGTAPDYALNNIQYITIASTGNALDFGDLSIGTTAYNGACSSSTRAVIGAVGWNGNGNPSNIIEYVTIASTGNAADFGDLLAANGQISACSNGHGGL